MTKWKNIAIIQCTNIKAVKWSGPDNQLYWQLCLILAKYALNPNKTMSAAGEQGM